MVIIKSYSFNALFFPFRQGRNKLNFALFKHSKWNGNYNLISYEFLSILADYLDFIPRWINGFHSMV